MPYPRVRDSVRLAPLASVLEQATSTTAAAIAIPKQCRAIVVVGATVKHLLGIGAAASAPDLDATNSVILQIGGAGEVIYPNHGIDAYLYVEAATSTGTIDVSFYA